MHNKANNQQNKNETYGMGKIFENHKADKGLMTNICKNSYNTIEIHNMIKIMAKDLNRCFFQKKMYKL